MYGSSMVLNGIGGVFMLLWYGFVFFLGICACVVLIKLAFGTLHIHITIDNPELFVKQQGVEAKRKTDVSGLVSIFEEEKQRREPERVAETQQEQELRRFKEMLKSDGLLSDREIEAITYEDLQRYKNNM